MEMTEKKEYVFCENQRVKFKDFNAEILWYLGILSQLFTCWAIRKPSNNLLVRLIVENMHKVHKIIKQVITKKFVVVKCLDVCYNTDWF